MRGRRLARTRLTHFTDDGAARIGTGEVREMTFEGSRGETVQMFVVLPPGFRARRRSTRSCTSCTAARTASRRPVPPRWNAQLFAAPGYVAALVNFQGSTSWGQDFAQRIQGEWAARPFEDVMKATDALDRRRASWTRQRMAAAGGSYGGYMVSVDRGPHRPLPVHRQSRRRLGPRWRSTRAT